MSVREGAFSADGTCDDVDNIPVAILLLCALCCQDGCLLQTYTGTGSVRSLSWFCDRSIAACFSRSKVRQFSGLLKNLIQL